jgi:hypothetical protein
MAKHKGRPAKKLKGLIIGRLEVIRKSGRAPNGEILWLCRCECGKQTKVLSGCLGNGNTSSCGCLKREQLIRRRSLPLGIASARHLIRNYKAGAKRRKRKFKLTEEEFLTICKSNCKYCNCPPTQVSSGDKGCNGKFIYNGIDRVDNNKGYTIENSVACCSICNIAKHQLSKDEFLNWITRVYNHSIREDK